MKSRNSLRSNLLIDLLENEAIVAKSRKDHGDKMLVDMNCMQTCKCHEYRGLMKRLKDF